MNKQELAAKIWQTADELRGSVDASQYKDIILGFIFYKYLSDKELAFLKDTGYEAEDIKNLSENDTEEVEYIKKNLGYFIAPENLFSTWVDPRSDFAIGDVTSALNAFDRNIGEDHKKIFKGIFQSFRSNLSLLGGSSANDKKRSEVARKIIDVIRTIPTDNKSGYDVLGYVYEYLLTRFAAGSGKKAGEFFTPHEVSVVKSLIIADYLEGRDQISILDPTSGSGSLLINIGDAFAENSGDKDRIKYYAQEINQATYNLTRMNLVMHDVLPSNINVRNGDSLARDYPYFEDQDPVGTYELVHVDAVSMNPPYSAKYDRTNLEDDPRFASYGLAPKSKADYAFLLHGLYHLKQDGIMTIVLPHGVLFRGGEEAEIRKNLILRNNIQAIIGLPANMFYGTGIPTIIMVLRKNKEDDHILFVDASEGYTKEGNKNVLRSGDIRKIVDTVTNEREEAGYSRLVPREEIEENEWNLNIPRYIESTEEKETYDPYALVEGGIPKAELKSLDEYWQAFPELYSELFREINSHAVELKTKDLDSVFSNNEGINNFYREYDQALANFEDSLLTLINNPIANVHPLEKKKELSHDLFDAIGDIEFINPYQAYQRFSEHWQVVEADLEKLNLSDEDPFRQLEPVMKMKNKKEVQDGWTGAIFPFPLVEKTLFKEDLAKLEAKEERLAEIDEEVDEMLESLSEEDGEYVVLNDNNDRFLVSNVRDELNSIFEDIEIPEVNVLTKAIDLGNKTAAVNELIEEHPEIDWESMDKKKSNGLPLVSELRDRISEYYANYEFAEDSFPYKLQKYLELHDEETDLNNEEKEIEENLEDKVMTKIKNLSDDEIKELLYMKWVEPIISSLSSLSKEAIKELKLEVEELADKYAETLEDIQAEIKETSKELSSMLDELKGSEVDMKAISSFQNLLEGF